MIGRAVELRALTGLLEQVPGGDGGIALFSGEAGIGKSHLLLGVLGDARTRGFDVAVGRCFADFGQRAFGPWREALGNVTLDGESTLGSLGAQDDRARSFERVLTRLAERASVRPLLVAVEDLHWADRDSLLLFRHLARFGISGPVLLVGTVRSPDLDAAQNQSLDEVLAELAREPRCQSFSLRALDEGESRAIAEELAGGAVPQSVASALHVEAGGNPLYVRELVRHLLEQGKLNLREGRLATDFALSELGLPPSIRHVVRQRVARLPEPTRALVRALSALSGPAELGTLARIADLEPTLAVDAVDPGLASGILRTLESRYELAHAIVKRAIYEELNPDRRAQLHRKAAEALERGHGVERAEIAAQYHASRGLPGAEAGVGHALEAAETARSTGAHERAASFLAMAHDLAGALDEAARTDIAARVAVARAEALELAGALAATEDAVQRLAASSAPERIPELFADVARALERGGLPRAAFGALVSRGLASVGERRDLGWARLALLSREPVPVLKGPIWVSSFPGYDPEAVSLLRESGSEHDFAATVDAHDVRSPTESQSLLAESRRFRDPAATIRILDTCARDVFFRAEDFPEAITRTEELLELSLRVGSLGGEVSARVVLACSLASLGDFSGARSALERVREIAARLGSMHRMNLVGPSAAETVLGYFTGLDASVGARLIQFVSTPSAGATPFGIVGLNLGLVGLALAGDAEGAGRLFPLHLEALASLPTGMNEWGAGRDCGATAAWLLGAREHAESYLALAQYDPPGTTSACWSSAAQSAARMTALLGNVDAARPLFEAARAGFERTGRRPSLAITWFDEALGLVRAGRSDDPRVPELLDVAERSFSELGMEPWLERAQTLRSAPKSRAPTLPDGLTRREAEVLSLLATGLANKEIAGKLFISVPTVERHIANVYDKIGTRSRAAATAYALRNGLV